MKVTKNDLYSAILNYNTRTNGNLNLHTEIHYTFDNNIAYRNESLMHMLEIFDAENNKQISNMKKYNDKVNYERKTYAYFLLKENIKLNTKFLNGKDNKVITDNIDFGRENTELEIG
jgi:hypothetical protein